MSYRYPGVFMREQHMGSQPIQAESTNETAFIGIMPRGPVNKPIRITNWTQVEEVFAKGINDGPFMEESYLAYSLFGYYDNGGFISHVVRVVGPEAEKASATFEEVDLPEEDFDLTIELDGDEVDEIQEVSLDPEASNFIERVMDDNDYVEVEYDPDASNLDFTALSEGEWGNGLKIIIDEKEEELSGGDADTDNITDTEFIDAIDTLDEVQSLDYLVVPDNQSEAVSQKITSYATNQGDMVGILDVPEDTESAEDVVTFRDNFNTRYGALAYPWIRVNDPIADGSDTTRWVPLGGHYAGLISRMHATRSVYVAPAGTDAQIFGALELKDNIDEGKLSMLTPANVNTAMARRNAGIVMWGARTLSSEGKYRYLNRRTGLNFLKKTLQANSDWAVFEPHNESLWRSIEESFESFLRTEIDKEGWTSNDPSEAFFVKCDGELNTRDYIEQGIIRARVGVDIAGTGEFFEITIGQWDGGSEAQEA